MKIQGNGKGYSLALSTTREERSIQFRKGQRLVLGLSSLVCKLTILTANVLSMNTITRRFLTSQAFQKCCLRFLPQYYEYNKTNTKLMD